MKCPNCQEELLPELDPSDMSQSWEDYEARLPKIDREKGTWTCPHCGHTEEASDEMFVEMAVHGMMSFRATITELTDLILQAHRAPDMDALKQMESVPMFDNPGVLRLVIVELMDRLSLAQL